MEKKVLGNTGLAVTPVGFGVLTMGKTQLDKPLYEGAALLRYALEQGLNFLDTAQYYETYPYIREALKGTNYEPIISSKCLDPSYSQMKAAVEEARSELNRDVIDIFLLHEVRSQEDWQNRSGAWSYLQEAREKGLVKAIGVSTHHVDVAWQAAQEQELNVLFPLINFRSLGIRKGNQPGTKEEMAAAIEKNAAEGKGVFTMKVFGGGNLTGHYLEALDYVRSLAGISSMMIGFGQNQEVDRILEYLDGSIDPHYRPDMTKKQIHIDKGDCESCGACIRRCPNQALSWSPEGQAAVDHQRCLTCGYCAPVCPVRAILLL
ncbi:4Fe-4S dicluster domain-containing protein [Aminipila butyrica]|uniref:4Fe-4S dicluster domain-containing protein n=1 Tax=Aminipila butyrica TaxID=433296 RepID=A0A858BWG2_9FIRM|nr:aldo/keto reductase [Aminipila butyrica]QIB69438.1 4Fe-4S dicluster domain-containing protein [Aminipila butyrica]